MRSYSMIELFHLTRRELFALHTEFQTELLQHAEGSTEHTEVVRNIRTIRLVLARRGPAP